MGLSRSSDECARLDIRDGRFHRGQGGIIVFQGDRDVLAFLGAHDEFCAVETDDRAADPHRICARCRAAERQGQDERGENGSRDARVFWKRMHANSPREVHLGFLFGNIADDGALPVLQRSRRDDARDRLHLAAAPLAPARLRQQVYIAAGVATFSSPN